MSEKTFVGPSGLCCWPCGTPVDEIARGRAIVELPEDET